MNNVEAHYEVNNLTESIRQALIRAGKSLDALTYDDLAPVDEFHSRGRISTAELADLGGITKSKVLDIGSGIGGTARFLAAKYGCDVSGIDLTAAYCKTATELSAMVGLSHATRFQQGNALELPFPDASFDLVWTEHVQMNISNKRRFYSEAARVLKPGGKLLFHDIFAGRGGEPHFPQPWATTAEISALARTEEVRAILDSIGLDLVHWIDASDRAKEFFEGLLARVKKDGPPPLGLHLLMPGTAPNKLGNLMRSLAEDRVRTVQAVWRKF